MVWRHPNATNDDPLPTAGSFSMADVRRLSAHVKNLRDMPEGVLVLSGLSQVWKSYVYDPVLRGADGNGTRAGVEVEEEPHLDVRSTLKKLPFYCTPPTIADAVILDPTPEDLVVGNHSSKILAKAEASQKRTFGATLSHVAKRTRFALAQSSSSTTRPSLFVGDSDDESDGDDDAYDEIPLVTPLRTAAVIPFSGNQGRSSNAHAAEGSNQGGQDRDPTWDCFCLCKIEIVRSNQDHSLGKGIMADDATAPFVGASLPRPSSEPIPSFRDEWDAPYRPTFGVLTKEVLKDPAICKTMSKAKGKERKKKIKSLTKSLDNLHAEVARLSTTLNQATMLKAEKDEEILHLKSTPSDVVQGEILSLAASDGFKHGLSLLKPPPLLLELIMPFSTRFLRDARVSSPITKELTVTPASKYLELSTNVDLTPYVVASEHNEEMGISVTLEDAMELVLIGLGCASAVAGDDAAANPLGGKLTVDVWLSIQRILSHGTCPRLNGFLLGTCSIAGQAFVDSLGKGIMADDVAAPFIGASRPRPSSGPVPSFRDVSGDVIHADFFPFFVGPYYATYPQDGIIGLRFSPPECGCSERVYWCGLWTKHQVLKPDEHIFGLNDKLVSSNSSFAKSKAKGKERKKKIKSLTKSLDNLHAEVACLSAALNQAIVLEAEKDEEILHLKSTPLDFSSFFYARFQDLCYP
ncbi:hypothetical protein Tco_0018771 [Tanacetum coccineum]